MTRKQLEILKLIGNYQYEYHKTDALELNSLKMAGLVNLIGSEFSKKPLHITLTKLGLEKLRKLRMS